MVEMTVSPLSFLCGRSSKGHMSSVDSDIYVGYWWLLEENTNVFTLSSLAFLLRIRMCSSYEINIPKKFKIVLVSIMW